MCGVTSFLISKMCELTSFVFQILHVRLCFKFLLCKFQALCFNFAFTMHPKKLKRDAAREADGRESETERANVTVLVMCFKFLCCKFLVLCVKFAPTLGGQCGC